MIPALTRLTTALCLVALSARPGFADDLFLDDRIERGRPVYALDSMANALAIPQKVVLLNPMIDNHHVSEQTEHELRSFMEANPDQMDGVKIRINQFAPLEELGRLTKNHRVSPLWRIFPGVPVTLWTSLTGRVLGGDNYNPYTHTISLYSDSPSVALHEAGHAADFASRSPGFDTDLYALGRVLPPVALYQEYTASEYAIHHYRSKRDIDGEADAYRTLSPAFGTYVGESAGIPYGNVAGAGVGHIFGLWKMHELSLVRDCMKVGEVVHDFENDPLASYLRQERVESDRVLSESLASKQQPLQFFVERSIQSTA